MKKGYLASTILFISAIAGILFLNGGEQIAVPGILLTASFLVAAASFFLYEVEN